VVTLWANRALTGRTYIQIMAQFHAKDYGTVQYNFHPDANIRGTIPDPSDDMLQTYHKNIRQWLKDSGLEDLPTEDELRRNPDRTQELIDRVEKFDQIDAHHKLLEIIAEVCQHQPSVDDMMQLPYRKRVRFTRFVQKELINPEA
jgi:hypothetical protein